ncbi:MULTISPECIES: ParB/RepB/Spo0J family partition protein [Ancylobacter]|uniref:ParB-like N-terminal domain-containing protein n=2 Tax=Ancylobacter TaxID=99 RepID=A0A839Z5X8_9HYPH|nr:MULTISPECIES: ParB/RepB/Spo0J family partition protein [Ancylobacter]MBB3769716.1 hypothetical protein [Ancylobacter tetraedralis]MDQ0512807.1 hypothetical protein [Ancylobacter amanitiformis]
MKTMNIDQLRKKAAAAKGKPTEPATVKLEDIRRDPAFQVRTGLDSANVRRLIGAYRSGTKVDPIVLAFCDDAPMPVIIDGHHRFEALEQIKQEAVDAIAVAVSRSEGRWLAAKANARHGRQLKRVELRRMFKTYVQTRQHVLRGGYSKDGRDLTGALKSYAEIAADIGVSKATVHKWMWTDFRKTALKMGGAEEFVGPGGLVEKSPEPQQEMRAFRASLSKLNTAFIDAEDYYARQEMLELLESTLASFRQQHAAEDELSTHWDGPDTTAEDAGHF